jgi:hypothetical protein
VTLVAKSFSGAMRRMILIKSVQDPSRNPREPIDVAPSGRLDLAAGRNPPRCPCRFP